MDIEVTMSFPDYDPADEKQRAGYCFTCDEKLTERGLFDLSDHEQCRKCWEDFPEDQRHE